MACIIKSVSVSEDESNFLKDYKLSATQLLKEKIWEMRGMLKTLAQERIDKQGRAIEMQQIEIDRLTGKLEENGILEKTSEQ